MPVAFDRKSGEAIAKAVVKVLKAGAHGGQAAPRSWGDTLILAKLNADLAALTTTPVDAEVLDTAGGSPSGTGKIVKVVDHLGWTIPQGKRVVLAPSHRDGNGVAVYYPIAAQC